MTGPETMTIQDILAAAAGMPGGVEILRGNRSAAFSGISIDSRAIRPGEMFWTLKGDRFDSHEFVAEVIARGAAGAVVGPDFIPPADWPQDRILIRVQDRLLAVQETARYLRRRFPVPLVAVTGSNGKTSTKEMIASIMSCQVRHTGGGQAYLGQAYLGQACLGKVLKTEGNRNNLIGLPLTLCGLSSEVDMAVLELGMNAFGEIRRLTRICQPDVGLITNIGPAHIEFFGSLEKISQAKKELFEEMKPEGVAIVNRDDPYGPSMATCRHSGRVITFGLGEGADLRGENIQCRESATTTRCTCFTLHLDGEKAHINLPLVGRMNVYNALAAAAAAKALDIPLHLIRQGLKQVVLPPMRMMRLKGRNGSIIINDAYNANPVSMRLAIDTLVQGIRGGGRTVLVLGDMLELGAEAEKFHREIGQFIASHSIDFLFTCGRLARWIAEEALVNGMEKGHIFPDLNHTQVAETLNPLLTPGDCVLVKGSRGAGMEGVVNMLQVDTL